MISVIITTYGGSEKIKRALCSILDQTNAEKEIIVVDDNEPESPGRKKTQEIMRGFSQVKEVTYIQHPHNMNGAHARNTGIKASKGEFITFLDDDDFYLSNRLVACEKFLHDHPETDGVCCGVLCLKNNTSAASVIQRNSERIASEELFLNDSFIGTGSNIFLRRQLVENLHGFDVIFTRFQDVEFMLRATYQASIAFIPPIMLVKDVSEIRSFNYTKFRNALEHFNRKFLQELLALAPEKRLEYYNRKAVTLLIYAVEDDREAHTEDCLAFLEEFRNMLKITESALPANLQNMKMKQRIKKGILRPVYHILKDIQDKKNSRQLVSCLEPALWAEALECAQKKY